MVYRFKLILLRSFYKLVVVFRKIVFGKLLVGTMLGIHSGKVFIIAASMKGSDAVKKLTGYENVTGGGQFFGIPHLYHILRQSFAPDDIVVRLSEDLPKMNKEARQIFQENIIILGGMETNAPGAYLLSRFYETTSLIHEETDKFIDFENEEFDAIVDERTKRLNKDHGLIIRTRNPHDDSKTLLMLIGVRTFGTAAAADFVSRPDKMACMLSRIKDKNNFAIMLRVDIDGCVVKHIQPVKIYNLSEQTSERIHEHELSESDTSTKPDLELGFLRFCFGTAILVLIANIVLLGFSFFGNKLLPLPNLPYVLLLMWAIGIAAISKIKIHFLHK